MESFVKGFLNPEADGSNSNLKYPPNIKNHVPSFLPKPSPTKAQSTEEKRIMGIEEAINQALGLEKEIQGQIERLDSLTPNPIKTTTDLYQFFFPPITSTTTTAPSTTTTEKAIEYSTNPSFEDLELLLSSLDKRISEREREMQTEKTHLLLTSRRPTLLLTLRTNKPRRREKPKTTNAPAEINLTPNFQSPSNFSPGSVTNLIMSQVRNGNVQMFLLKNLIQFIQSPVETIQAVECSLFQICDFNYFS